MAAIRHCAVIDIGKTNAKLALVDLDRLIEIGVCRRPNKVIRGDPYPHYDTGDLWTFILDSLKQFNADRGVDAITVTTHGASAALLDGNGTLAAPVLDYEHGGPDALASDYDAVRPEFAETGSPRLPLGLNLGAQLYWQFRTFNEIAAKTRMIVTYPQYWAFRLTGVAANEATSLGCHTDLWCPRKKSLSTLVDRMGWAALMAPVAGSLDCLGPILADVATTTGLSKTTPVHCGIHDSNASLYSHLVSREPPFAVVSTGTWVISMAIGGRDVDLDPFRDTLMNVNAFGDPVPSARFMGGREFDRIMDGCSHGFTADDVAAVLDRGTMLLPSVEHLSGPFQGYKHRWIAEGAVLSDGQRFVAASFYLALMTATGLEMVGAQGPVLVEGPFADNPTYLDMLASATGLPVGSVAGTGTSIGAALLVPGKTQDMKQAVQFRQPQNRMARYGDRWREQLRDRDRPAINVD